MFRLNSGKKLLLFIDFANSGDVEFAISKGRKIVEMGHCSFEEIPNLKKDKGITYARIAFLSELSYFDITNLTIRNKKFAKLGIKKYINDQSVFMEPFEIKYKELSKSDSSQLYAMCALPKSDLSRIDFLRKVFIVEYIIPVEYALLNISKISSQNPQRIVWAYNNFQVELEIENSHIQSKSTSAFNENEEIESNFYGENTLFLGSLSKLNQNIDYNGDGLRYAHLYSLLLADKSFDFIDDDYMHSIVSYELSRIVFGLSIAVSLVLGFLSYVSYSNYIDLNNQFIYKQSMLERKKHYINSNMPKKS
jgi:hypothetical protein